MYSTCMCVRVHACVCVHVCVLLNISIEIVKILLLDLKLSSPLFMADACLLTDYDCHLIYTMHDVTKRYQITEPHYNLLLTLYHCMSSALAPF